MTIYQPATAHSDSIMRPNCPKCGTAMLLFGIEPEKLGFELLSFDCPKCRHIEVTVGKAPAMPISEKPISE
jgi:Zn finger protein HypA/HybF involved in hydrogenase expression